MSKDLSEKILVIPSASLNGQEGLIHMPEAELEYLIISQGQYKLRSPDLESDETYKQLITYPLLRHEGKFLFARRTNKGGESRLHGMGLIGFGGHVRAEDIEDKPFDTWIERELREELDIKSRIIGKEYLGLINDNSNPVGKVHAGVVVIVDLDGPEVFALENTHESLEWLQVEVDPRRQKQLKVFL